MRLSRPLSPLFLAGLLAIGVLGVPAAGAAVPSVAGPAAAPSVSFPGHDGATRRFWTPARMRAARPIEGAGPAAHASVLNPTLTATSETIADPTAPEYRVNGAIFISEGAGIGYGRCSGTSVISPNKSVVITAGPR